MRRNIFVLKIFLLCILLNTSAGYSNALTDNNKGTISGKVTDRSNGQPLPYANIILDGTALGGTSDASGNYSIINIPVGSYTVKFMFIGYKPLVKTDVIVSSKRTTIVDAELEETPIKLGEINVTPDYFEKNHEILTSVKSLDYEEIRRSPGAAEDAFRAILSLPGVSTGDETQASLMVRGGNNDENLILIDNIEIYNPFHFSQVGAGQGALGIISSEVIRKIDFLTGGFPVRYGDKLSSVYDITLKEGNKQQFAGDVYLNFGGFGGVFNGPISKSGSYLFTVRRGFFDLITDLMNDPVSAQYYDALGKINYELSPKHKLSFVTFYFQDKFSESQTKKEEQNTNESPFQKQKADGLSLGSNWRYLFSDKGYSLVTAFWTMNNFSSYSGPVYNPNKFGSESKENEIAIKGEILYQITKKSELKAGISGKPIDGEEFHRADNDTLPSGIVIPSFQKKFSTNKMMFKGESFIQLQHRMSDGIIANAGLRYDYFDYNKEGNLSSRFGISWQLSNRTTLTAAYGQFYQTPAFYKIAMQSGSNEKLKNSKATHYVVGVEHLLAEDTKLTTEIFYKDMKDLITRPNDEIRILLENEKGYSEGVEFSIHKKMSSNWYFLLSYTYSIAKRENTFIPIYYYADVDRRHITTVEGIYKISNVWQLAVKFHIASGNPYTPVVGRQLVDGIWQAIEGERNSARYPDYHKLDIRVDKRYNFEKWNITVYFDVWNVYNRRNVGAYIWNGDYSEMKTLYQFSIMPMFGISAEF